MGCSSPSSFNLYIEPGHPDAGAPLLEPFARAFAAMGAEVVIARGDDNLIRSRLPHDPGDRPFVVVAAGLPNLVHEFAHAIQVGRLADDHGFDYGLIPLDVKAPAQRLLMWQELACSVVSCAYAPAGTVDAWFKEQVEIQGVFYGIDDGDVGGFVALVEAAVAAHPGELTAVVDAAYDAIAQALLGVGVPIEEVHPPRRWSFADLWARYRASLRLPAEPVARG